MTLTEQLKKWELPEGWYYLKVNEELANYPVIAECVVDYSLGSFLSYFYEFDTAKIKQVLAPVPSYEEWQASEKYNKHLEEVIKIYERKDKQATKTSIAYNELLEENTKLKEQVNHLLKTQARQFVDNQKLQVKAKKAKDVVNIDTARQIKQLKGLLKECLEVLTMVSGETVDFPRTVDECIDKIKQALGEDK